MNKLLILLILRMTYSAEKLFIRNIGLPICVNCIHFIEYKNNYPYDPFPNDNLDGRCKKFGEIDSITGVIEYDFARHCRNNEKKCGKTGTEYKEK